MTGPFRMIAEAGRETPIGVGPDGRLVRIERFQLGDEIRRQLFDADARAAACVAGPSVAAVVDADSDTGTGWLATELVAGPTLDEAIRRYGPLPIDSVTTIAAGVARALADIHRAGIVHGGLRAHAVVLAAEGPRVTDFGMNGLRSNRTREPADDIAALGRLLVTAATGTDEPARVPEPVRDLVNRCLDPDPTARPDAVQLCECLETPRGGPVWPEPIHEEIRQRTAQLPQYAPLRRRAADRRPVVIAAAVIAVIAVVAGLITAIRWTDGSASALSANAPATSTPSATGQAVVGGTPLNRDRTKLRNLDLCALFDEQVFTQIGRPEYPPQSTWFDHCSFFIGPSRDGRFVSIEITDIRPDSSDRVDTVRGVPVRTPQLGGPSSLDLLFSCTSTLAIDDNVGLAVRVDDGDPRCPLKARLIDIVIDRLLTAPPQASPLPGTLNALDPCVVGAGLVDPATGKINERVDLLHSCVWHGDWADVTLEFRNGPLPDDSGVRKVAIAGETGTVEVGYDTCTAAFLNVKVNHTGHIAELKVEVPERPLYPATPTNAPRHVGSDELCDQATSILEKIVAKLPVPGK